MLPCCYGLVAAQRPATDDEFPARSAPACVGACCLPHSTTEALSSVFDNDHRCTPTLTKLLLDAFSPERGCERHSARWRGFAARGGGAGARLMYVCVVCVCVVCGVWCGVQKGEAIGKAQGMGRTTSPLSGRSGRCGRAQTGGGWRGTESNDRPHHHLHTPATTSVILSTTTTTAAATTTTIATAIRAPGAVTRPPLHIPAAAAADKGGAGPCHRQSNGGRCTAPAPQQAGIMAHRITASIVLLVCRARCGCVPRGSTQHTPRLLRSQTSAAAIALCRTTRANHRAGAPPDGCAAGTRC